MRFILLNVLNIHVIYKKYLENQNNLENVLRVDLNDNLSNSTHYLSLFSHSVLTIYKQHYRKYLSVARDSFLLLFWIEMKHRTRSKKRKIGLSSKLSLLYALFEQSANSAAAHNNQNHSETRPILITARNLDSDWVRLVPSRYVREPPSSSPR